MGRLAEMQRKLLEQMMGPEAMGTANANLTWQDEKVCRNFLCGTCPHTLFTNTKMDLGACPKSHTERLKTEFLAAREANPSDPIFNRFQMEYESNIFAFVDECDRRIRAAHRRLEKTPEENAKTTNLMREIAEIELAIQGGTEKIEALGEQGKVDESMREMAAIEALKSEKADKERELQQLTDTSGASGHQKLRVCDVCGAYLSVLDSDRRLADHFGGKMHLGYHELRNMLAKFKEEREKRAKAFRDASSIPSSVLFPASRVKQEIWDDDETALAPELDICTLPAWREQLPLLQELQNLIRGLRSAGPTRHAEWERGIDRRVSSRARYARSRRTEELAEYLTEFSACTSVPIRVLSHTRDDVAAEITLLEYADFKREIEELTNDLHDEYDNPNSWPAEKQAAWTKLITVYPSLKEKTPQEVAEMQAETILNSNHYISDLLKEHTRTIHAPNFETLLADIRPFLAPSEVDSLGNDDGLQDENAALWPLVSQVDVYCRSELLSTGLVLVDLPGGGDANRARTRIAESYMDTCDHLMVVSTAVRPGDEATFQDLMTKALRNRLRLTKSDDISADEIIRSMGRNLPEELRVLQEKTIPQNIKDLNLAKRDLQVAREKEKACVEAILRFQQGQAPQVQASTSGVKRKCTDTQAEASKRPKASVGVANRHGPSNAAQNSASQHLMISPEETSLQDLLSESFVAREAQTSAESMVEEKEHKLSKLRIMRTTLCAKVRSEVCALYLQLFAHNVHMNTGKRTRRILADNFRRELHDLQGNNGPNPTVISVSAKEFSKFKGRLVDGEPIFTSEEDTGIPALRRHLLGLANHRYRASIEGLKHLLHNLATSLSRYIDNDTTDDTHKELKLAMIARWDSTHRHRISVTRVKGEDALGAPQQQTKYEDFLAPRLEKVLMDLIKRKMETWQSSFPGRLCTNATNAHKLAAQEAPAILLEVISRMRWQTLNAVCRRDGEYREHDLNDVLSQPFVEKILGSWQRTFRTRVFEDLREKAVKSVNVVLEDVRRSVMGTPIQAVTLRRMHMSADALEDSLELLLGQINEILQSKQVSLSSNIVPFIQAKMVPAYIEALGRTGPGSLAVRRTRLHTFVKTRSEELYEGLSQVLQSGLAEILAEIKTLVTERFEELAVEIQDAVTAAWQSPRENPDERAAEQRVKEILATLDEFADSLPLEANAAV
ncbi:hypothetical protein NM688_g1695 [Phlebia brevispora]|uniref:Uncharacterized protein n=1 Tax=Phlebia brevispora TaxID=194682 RepID=A0ACC1TAL2_9APHY|nr:hypothetical protein NM688_g1695 [Phlebia brevispora]